MLNQQQILPKEKIKNKEKKEKMKNNQVLPFLVKISKIKLVSLHTCSDIKDEYLRFNKVVETR